MPSGSYHKTKTGEARGSRIIDCKARKYRIIDCDVWSLLGLNLVGNARMYISVCIKLSTFYGIMEKKLAILEFDMKTSFVCWLVSWVYYIRFRSGTGRILFFTILYASRQLHLRNRSLYGAV